MKPILHLSIPVRDLEEARRFYVDVLGCEVGRVRERWLDVWFYGMQVTLHERPDELLTPEARGVRHFGVTVTAGQLAAVLTRVEAAEMEFGAVEWVRPLATDYPGTPREQTKAMIADPSGNAIELKSYIDPAAAFADS